MFHILTTGNHGLECSRPTSWEHIVSHNATVQKQACIRHINTYFCCCRSLVLYCYKFGNYGSRVVCISFYGVCACAIKFCNTIAI